MSGDMGKEGTEYRVVIPTESYRLVKFQQQELPGIAVINEALASFDPKAVFAWHLSLHVQFEDLILNGMPSEAEREVVDPFGDSLDIEFKGDESAKPNALFLARVTWNNMRELVYRVYDPEPINRFLQSMIASKSHPRPFAYRMDPDPEWRLARWFLAAGVTPESNGSK